jgi:hypothetical protein
MGCGASKPDAVTPANPRIEANFIPFEDFKREGVIPRRGHTEGFKHALTGQTNRNLCRPRSTFNQKIAFSCFVSHRWLSPGGKDGHPDDKDGSKFKLIVEAVEKLLLSKPMKGDKCEVALWIDFGCVDQDLENPAEELNELHEIIAQCDVLLTPVHDPEHAAWEIPAVWTDHYKQYQAKAWQVYWSRAWCATEAMSAACMPVVPSAKKRGAVFRQGGAIWAAVSQGRRPHIVYGTKQSVAKMQPMFFPPLLHSNLAMYDPAKMELTSEKDRGTIKKIAEGLRKHIKDLEVGWKGPKNGEGKPHGRGKYVYPNGDVFEGEYKDGKKNKGKYRFATGSVYEGPFLNDKKEGRGSFKFASGDVYEGEYKDGKKEGKGVMKFGSGAVYEGEWKDDKKNGKGTMKFANGNVYEGEWKDDKKHGKGAMKYAEGKVEDGEWREGKFSG